MPAENTEQTPKMTPRLGVPSEARLQDQRQRANEEESRRYSNLTPGGRIAGGWQFIRILTQRQWSAGGMVTLWLVMGVPALALMAAGVLSVLTHAAPAERAVGILQVFLVPGIPLFALSVLTRRWLQQRKLVRALRRRS